MIGIKYNGNFLYLPPSASVRMKLFSNLFHEDQGSYSFPFTFPIENNSIYLDCNDLIKVKGKVNRTFAVDLYLYGNFWKKGLLRIKNVTPPNFIANLNVDAAVLANDILNKKLSDLDYGADEPLRSDYPYLKVILQGGGTGGNVTFVINGLSKTVTWNTSNNQTMIDMAAAYMADTAGRAAAYMGDVLHIGNATIKVYSNDLYIRPEYLGFLSVPGAGRSVNTLDFLNCGDIRDKMLDAAQSSYPTYNYTFFPVKNPDFYSDKNATYNGYINYYSGGKFVGNSLDGAGFFAYNICPFLYLQFVLKAAFNASGLNIAGNILSDADFKKIVIYNNYALDNMLYTQTGTLQGNNWMTKIKYKNHVPDISVGEFLKAVRSTFFLAYMISNENAEVNVKTLEEIITSSDYEDWTNIASPDTDEETSETDGYILQPQLDDSDDAADEVMPDVSSFTIKEPVNTVADLPTTGNENNDLRLVKNLNHYYKVSQYLDTTASPNTLNWRWDYYSENLNKFTIGNGKEKLEFLSGVVNTKKITSASAPDKNWIIPYAKQTGSSPEYGLGQNPYTLRFLLYQGLQPGKETDNSPITYPLGTPYERDYDENVIGDLRLSIEGDNGIYNKFAKKWLSFLSTARPIKFNLPGLDETRIRSLDFSIKKRIDGVDYLLADIDITYAGTGIKTPVGYFYKV
jgi:hypothetical protein